MTKAICHRCSADFKNTIRLILHLNKNKKCAITNINYDIKFDMKLMEIIKQNNIVMQNDLNKYITKVIDDNDINKYKCNLCGYLSLNKYSIKRHMMESCLHEKYTLPNDLLKLISYAKDSQTTDTIMDQEIDNSDYHMYEKHISQLPLKKVTFICVICEKIFKSKNEICVHMKEMCMSYQCDYCGNCFTKEEFEEHQGSGCDLNLVDHVDICEQNKNNTPRSKLLIKRAITPLMMNTHIDSQESPENNIVNEREWQLYIKYINIYEIKNSNKYIYECKVCSDFGNKSKQMIINHIHSIHSDKIDIGMDIDKIIEAPTESFIIRDEVSSQNNNNSLLMDKQKELEKKIAVMEQQLLNFSSKPSNINNLNLYLHDNGDCLKILEERTRDFPKSLDFIKNCALSQLTGDIRLIEKIYLDSPNPAVYYLDKNKKKLAWKNEKGEEKIDTGGVVGRKLASNLQKGYINGVNHLIKKNTDEKRCPLKFLGEYDIQMWNDHIYQLCDVKYQKKLIYHSDIPIKPAVN